MKENQKELEELIYTLGYIDSMISIASFRETSPYYTCPEFREEKERIWMWGEIFTIH